MEISNGHQPSQSPARAMDCTTPDAGRSDLSSSFGASSSAPSSAPPSVGPLERKKLAYGRVEKYDGSIKPAPATPQRRQTATGGAATAGLLERNKVLEAQLAVVKTEIQSWKNRYEAEQVKNERLHGRLNGLQETTSALDSHLTKTRQNEDMKGKTAEIEVLRSRLVERELSISNLKAKTSALHEESQKGQNKVMDYKLHLQQKTSQLEETRRREREATEKNVNLETQIKELNRQVQRHQHKAGQHEQKISELEALRKDYAALKAEVTQTKEADEFRKLRSEGKTEQMAAYQTQLEAANNMKSRLESLEKHNEVLRSRMKAHNEIVQKLQQKEQSLKEANAQIETLETSSRRMAQQVVGKNEKLEELNFKVTEAKRIIQDLTRQKAELEMKNETLQGKKETFEGLKDIAESKLLQATKEQLQKAVEGGRTDMLPQLYSQVENLTQQLEMAQKEVNYLERQLKEKPSDWMTPARDGNSVDTARESEDAKMDLQAAQALVQKYRKDKEKYKLLALDLQQKYEEKKMYYKTKVESWEQENNQKTQNLEEALKQKESEMKEALQKESQMKEALEKKEQEVVAARVATQSASASASASASTSASTSSSEKRSNEGENVDEGPSKMPKAAGVAKGKGKGKGKGPPPPPPKAAQGPPSRKPAVPTFDGIKLRPLFWAPAQSYGENSIWSSMMTSECTREQEAELEELFLPKPDAVGKVFERKDSIKTLTVLDHSKQQSLSIQFRSIPSPGELMSILQDGDHKELSAEQVIALVKEGFVSEDTILQIKSLQTLHPMAPLGLPEQYFLALSEMPEAKDLLRIWMYIANFPVETSSLFEKLNAVRQGADALRECPEFPSLLCKLLAAGNRLNAGSVRSNYKGFSIESLTKFGESKTTVGSNQSLLHVVVNPVTPQFIKTIKNLSELVEGSCVCMKDLETQVTVVQNEAKVVRGLVYGANPKTNWQRCTRDAETVLTRTDVLIQTLQESKLAVTKVLEFFGVALDKPTEEFFRVWQQFLGQLLALNKDSR